MSTSDNEWPLELRLNNSQVTALFDSLRFDETFSRQWFSTFVEYNCVQAESKPCTMGTYEFQSIIFVTLLWFYTCPGTRMPTILFVDHIPLVTRQLTALVTK